MIESFSPVLPRDRLGIGDELMTDCSAWESGSRILAELATPAAVPIFKN
jgi:hypothetical protein